MDELGEKLRMLRDRLGEGLVERGMAVRLGLLGALAGEHLLLLGPPGTAKSLVARRLRLAFRDATYFERLLTRFSVPEELFGPLSIRGLEEDRYERLTEAYLPRASIAFLDEIFKANSAILNALLTLLNEREFDNGTRRQKTPLITVVGASNELPAGEELDALFDRFLLRLHVGPVTKEAFGALLALRGQATPEIPPELKLSREELDGLQRRAQHVLVPGEVVDLLVELRDWCTAEGIQVSDRRWRQVLKLLQVSAATNGRDEVSVWDCWLIQHCLWDTPEAREKVFEWYAQRVGASDTTQLSKLGSIVKVWEGRLEDDQKRRAPLKDADGQPLFMRPDGEYTREKRAMVRGYRAKEPLFLAPLDLQDPVSGSLKRRRAADVPLAKKPRARGARAYTRAELDNLCVGSSWDKALIFKEWQERDAYLKDQNNWFMEERDLPPALEPAPFQSHYINGCVSEIAGLSAKTLAYAEKLDAHIKSLQEHVSEHLWVSREFAEPTANNLARTRRALDKLLKRIDTLREGFSRLPRKPDNAISSENSIEIVQNGSKTTDKRS